MARCKVMRRVRIWARLVIDKDAELTLIVEEAVAEVPVAITCEEKQQKLNMSAHVVRFKSLGESQACRRSLTVRRLQSHEEKK
jgi:hypothetical protein